VTRIIAGFAGSLVLSVPKNGTRPTSDRVREAIFSALEARDALDGARVVDLFAGSGALGLEAVSRGAASAVLVEKASSAVQACRANAAKVLKGAPASVTVEVAGQAVLPYLVGSAAQWDVVFLDPPYEFTALELGQTLEALVPRLAPDAIVLVERSSRDTEPAWPGGIELDRRKDYGDTTLWWATAASR
jgi:16S rRNA (guanine966-N2)-methyltransferase